MKIPFSVQIPAVSKTGIVAHTVAGMVAVLCNPPPPFFSSSSLQSYFLSGAYYFPSIHMSMCDVTIELLMFRMSLYEQH